MIKQLNKIPIEELRKRPGWVRIADVFKNYTSVDIENILTLGLEDFEKIELILEYKLLSEKEEEELMEFLFNETALYYKKNYPQSKDKPGHIRKELEKGNKEKVTKLLENEYKPFIEFITNYSKKNIVGASYNSACCFGLTEYDSDSRRKARAKQIEEIKRIKGIK